MTFEDVLQIVRAMETAAKNLLEMQQGGLTSTATQAPVAVLQTSSRRDHTPEKSKCSRCLAWHLRKPCRFQTAECRKCKKRGHIARACRSQSNQQEESKAAHQIGHQKDFQELEEMLETAMNAVHIVGRGNEVKPLKVEVVINQQKVEMEIDTGAAITLVNEATFKALWSKRKAPGFRRPQVQLRTYSGESLTLVGETDVKVRYGQQVAFLPLIIVKGKGPNLFSRNWMQTLKLKWEEIFHLHINGRTSHVKGRIQHKELITKYQEVFKEEMGLLEGATASIAVRADTAPRFFKPRHVPYAYKELVERELRRLERDKIIEAVRFFNWAAPVEPVLKRTVQSGYAVTLG